MNSRVLASGFLVFRTCSFKNIQPRFVTGNSRYFSFLAARLYPGNVKRYTEQHEWIEISDGKVGVVGITDYAQQLLGDVVFVELPPVDSFVTKGDELGAVESVKSASDIYAPMSGQVYEVNEELTSKPSLINKSAEDDGWICKIAVSESEEELTDLLTEEQYNDFLAAQHDEESLEEPEHQNNEKK